MSSKTMVWVGMFIGSFVGGYIPVLFGASFLSIWSLIGNGLGGIIGIFVAYKLTN